MRRSVTGVLMLLAILLSSVLIASAADQPPRIMVDEVKAKMDSGQDILFLDTRNGSAWSGSNQMIPGAVRVRGDADFSAILAKVPKETFIVTYCT